MPNNYTWTGTSGGDWTLAANWEDQPGTNDTGQAPGSLDTAQFIGFSGLVTGALAAALIAIGPGDDVTLDGSGFATHIQIGQDVNFDLGAAALEIGEGGGGNVIAVTLLDIGTPLGGSGTLIVNGTFSSAGGVNFGAPEIPGTIVVNAGGLFDDGISLTMYDGGSISVAASGQFVVGSTSGTGIDGAVLIANGSQLTGTGSITGNVVDNGMLVTSNFGDLPTVLAVSGNITGTGAVSVGLELDAGGAIGSGVTVSLFGIAGQHRGILRLAQPASDAGTLDTLSTNSTIVLTGLDFDSAVWTPDELTMTGNSGTLALATTGDHSHQSFVTFTDAVSGTDVVVACFAEGTRIRTRCGEVAVNALRPGDRAVSAFGGTVPVIWTGHRRVDCRRHSRPDSVWPVRIRAGALADGVPRRDLLLSPDHAIHVDDVLIPIRCLVNGTTIAREPVDAITYWHLELPVHDVVFAEGLGAEFYLDTGNRGAFAGCGPLRQLHPDFARDIWLAEACAPQITHGPILARVAARIAARARSLVPIVTDCQQMSHIAPVA